MNPKLMAWALWLSLAANVAAVACWPRVRESEAGNAPPVGRFTFAQQGASITRCDTATGRVEVGAVVAGKWQLVELISAHYPTATGASPLIEP